MGGTGPWRASVGRAGSPFLLSPLVGQVHAHAGQPLPATFQREWPCLWPPCGPLGVGPGWGCGVGGNCASEQEGGGPEGGAGVPPGPECSAGAWTPHFLSCSFSRPSRPPSRDCPPCSHTQAPSGPCRALFSPRYWLFLGGRRPGVSPGVGVAARRGHRTHTPPLGTQPQGRTPNPQWGPSLGSSLAAVLRVGGAVQGAVMGAGGT